MNVLVTGGLGFIGSHISKQLARAGHTVVALDDLSGGFLVNTQGSDVIPVVGSCDDPYMVGSLCEEHNIDTLVHCAANARESMSQYQPAIVTKRNLYAYMVTLGTCIRSGVKRVVCFSSTAVYGEGAKHPPFDETLPLAPEDIYGINKMAMETATEVLCSVHGAKYVILRPHNVFGEGQSLCDKYRNVVAIWMNLIMRGEPICVYGDGSMVRAFSYIYDSLPSFMNAVFHVEHLHGHAINVGGTVPVTLMDLLNCVREAMGAPDHPVTHLPDRVREVHSVFTTHDKSQRMLDYKEDIGWQKGVRFMAEWAKQQGPQEWKNADPVEIKSDLIPENVR